MLKIRDLHVQVEGKPILNGIDLDIGPGETHVLLGPNGGGKTTLLMSIMGMPRYKVTKGSIHFEGRDITNMGPDERARLGIGLMFQKPAAVEGLRLGDLAEMIENRRTPQTEDRPDPNGKDGDGSPHETGLNVFAERLNLKEHLARDVNRGFSGGEMKRSEVLQLLCQSPGLVLLDEPESGVDLDNISLIGDAINRLLDKDLRVKERKASGLMVTHTGHILSYVNATLGHVLVDGRIVCEGSPADLLEDIKRNGYRGCVNCRTCEVK
ncbi:MAG: ABC transporter ATP-binding protein [Bacillota bacterium]